MVAERRRKQPEPSAQWLEEELRDAQARLKRMETGLDQALKHSRSLEADLRKLAESLASSGVESGALPGMKEELRQLRDQIDRVQERQMELSNRTEEALRHSQADVGRERQEHSATAKQVEAITRGVQQFESRIQALDDAFRRLEEEVAGARLADQGLTRDLEELSSRTARNLEAATRLEHELSRAAGKIDAVHKQDEALGERLNLLLEQLRRHSERLDKLDEAAAFPLEAKEALKRAELEREQLAGRLVNAERVSGELEEKVGELMEGLARLDQRSQAHTGQLLAMAQEMLELGEQTKGQVKRLFQVVIRQRRRQAEALAQEIKELSQGEGQARE